MRQSDLHFLSQYRNSSFLHHKKASVLLLRYFRQLDLQSVGHCHLLSGSSNLFQLDVDQLAHRQQ